MATVDDKQWCIGYTGAIDGPLVLMKSKTYANGDEKSRDPSPHIVTRNHCSSLPRRPSMFEIYHRVKIGSVYFCSIEACFDDIDLFLCGEMKMGVSFHVNGGYCLIETLFSWV